MERMTIREQNIEEAGRIIAQHVEEGKITPEQAGVIIGALAENGDRAVLNAILLLREAIKTVLNVQNAIDEV